MLPINLNKSKVNQLLPIIFILLALSAEEAKAQYKMRYTHTLKYVTFDNSTKTEDKYSLTKGDINIDFTNKTLVIDKVIYKIDSVMSEHDGDTMLITIKPKNPGDSFKQSGLMFHDKENGLYWLSIHLDKHTTKIFTKD